MVISDNLDNDHGADTNVAINNGDMIANQILMERNE